MPWSDEDPLNFKNQIIKEKDLGLMQVLAVNHNVNLSNDVGAVNKKYRPKQLFRHWLFDIKEGNASPPMLWITVGVLIISVTIIITWFVILFTWTEPV